MHKVKFLVGPTESDATEVVKAEFSAAEWATLERFRQYVGELIETSRLAREGMPVKLDLNWTQEEGLKVGTKLPNWDDVIVLLHKLRPLILESESVFFSKVKKIISRRVNNKDTRRHLRLIQQQFSGDLFQETVVIYASSVEHDEFHVINSEKTLQAWLNGFEFHRDDDKRAYIESLHGLMPLESSQVLFLLMLQEKIHALNALADMVKVLRGEKDKLIGFVPEDLPLRHRVVLLPSLDTIQYLDEFSDRSDSTITSHFLTFHEPQTSSVIDFMSAIVFLWNRWIDGSIPPVVGKQDVFLEVPDGFLWPPKDKPSKNGMLIFRINIQALIFSQRGKIRFGPKKDKSTGNVYFGPDEASIQNRVRTAALLTQVDLQDFLAEATTKGSEILKIVKIPRFIFRSCFWPPTQRAGERLVELTRQGKDPEFEEVEGTDLAVAWEIFAEQGISLEDFSVSLEVQLSELVADKRSGKGTANEESDSSGRKT